MVWYQTPASLLFTGCIVAACLMWLMYRWEFVSFIPASAANEKELSASITVSHHHIEQGCPDPVTRAMIEPGFSVLPDR